MKATLSLIFVFFLIFLAGCKPDACDTVVCKNDGVCKDGLCTCPAGFTGVNCEIKINPCFTLGCDTTNSYCDTATTPASCICNDGWEGALCNKTWAQKYYGTYNASEFCNGTSEGYAAEIISGTKFNSFVIKNFHNQQSAGTTAKILCELLTPYNFKIPGQYMSFGYVEGGGEMSSTLTSIEVSYRLIPIGTTDTTDCTLVLQK